MTAAWWLLASENLGKAFQAHSRRSGSWSDGIWFLLIVALTVAFFAIMYYWDRIKISVVGAPSHEEALLSDLCKLHHLSTVESELLSKALGQISLPQPAFIFVDRTILTQFSNGQGAPKRTCTALIKKIFGDAETE